MLAHEIPAVLPLDPAKGSPLEPVDAHQTREIVEWAAANSETLDIQAGGSKRHLGRPTRANHTLSLHHLTGVIDYEPSELVITARAATPMTEIHALLDASHQSLAFEPPDYATLLGDGAPTLGGTIACNIAGPRRVRAGAARDHFLGFAAINGRGESWKAGGRVVKNVTGYDLCKLQAGAFGTLSVLTELSVRVMPKPETACTLLLSGLDDEAAIALMARALNTPHEVSAAAHLPQAVARRAGVAAVAVTTLRLEGPGPSVAFRENALQTLLGRATRLDDCGTKRLWSAIGAVQPLLDPAGVVLWRLCPKPSAASAAVNAIQRSLSSAEAFYDWAGGLVWVALDPTEAGLDAGAVIIRDAVRRSGGHAELFVAPDQIRSIVPVFEPLPDPLAALTRRVKGSFDPNGVLNPGRMQEGV